MCVRQIGPGSEVEKQFGERANGVLGIEQGLPGDLGGPGASRLPYHNRLDLVGPHALGERPHERGFARALGALENDEEPVAHPSVMMLLAAPLSMPSLIC